jgi:GNAT superfamily N-acetyltransferase
MPAGRAVVQTSEMNLSVHPAHQDRFDDLQTILCPRQNPRACWCLTYRLPNAENSALMGSARAERMRALCAGVPAPGVIAYADDQAAGWCAVGPRTDFVRLVRSKTIPILDAIPVWSIVCLVVRPGFRRMGVAGALIRGALRYAADQGATAVEAYPIDNAGQRVSATLAFTGTTKLFAAAGFVECAPTLSKSAGLPRVLMRCEVGPVQPASIRVTRRT